MMGMVGCVVIPIVDSQPMLASCVTESCRTAGFWIEFKPTEASSGFVLVVCAKLLCQVIQLGAVLK